MKAPFLTALKRISTPKGDVLHGMKASDPGYEGFGEAYFSQVFSGDTKGWKRHLRMTLNLVCVAGAIRVMVREGNGRMVLDTELSPDTPDLYHRLTVPPGYFVAFQGVSPHTSMLLNVASIPHDPEEAETLPLDAFGDVP